MQAAANEGAGEALFLLAGYFPAGTQFAPVYLSTCVAREQ